MVPVWLPGFQSYCMCVYGFTAELEKKLAELQKFVKNEGEPLPAWMQEEMEKAGLSSKSSSLSKVCVHVHVW